MFNARLLVVFFALVFLLTSTPTYSFHPLSTDDPGTTDYRHFELEWGNDLAYPEDSLEESSGYLAVKAGLAPGLEFDAALNFTYWMDTGGDYTSGWGDVEMLLKYRFIGDGDGPFNLGVETIGLFPSGERDKGLSEGGDHIIPTAFLFGTVGHGPIRILLNAGGTSVPDEDDTMLYGGAVEWSATEKMKLVGEVFGESDLEEGGGNDPLEGLMGVLYSPRDWITLSAGAGIGMAPDSPDFHVTFATLLGW